MCRALVLLWVTAALVSASGTPLRPRTRSAHHRAFPLPFLLAHRRTAARGSERVFRVVVGVVLGVFCAYGVAFFVSVYALGVMRWTAEYVRGQTEVVAAFVVIGALLGGAGMAGQAWMWYLALLAIVSVQFIAFFMALDNI